MEQKEKEKETGVRTLSLLFRNRIRDNIKLENLPFVIQMLLLGGALLANGAAAAGAAVETAGGENISANGLPS